MSVRRILVSASCKELVRTSQLYQPGAVATQWLTIKWKRCVQPCLTDKNVASAIFNHAKVYYIYIYIHIRPAFERHGF